LDQIRHKNIKYITFVLADMVIDRQSDETVFVFVKIMSLLRSWALIKIQQFSSFSNAPMLTTGPVRSAQSYSTPRNPPLQPN